MTIDVHAHVVFEELFGAAGEHGPELTIDDAGVQHLRVGSYLLSGVRYRGSPMMDPALRIAAMDDAGIDLQILSPLPLFYFHKVEPELAVPFCRRHNELLAELVGRHPSRLRGLAALPMQDEEATIAEFRRAVGELGLVGAAIGTDFGRPFDDPALDGFYETATELDVPVFIHPGPGGTCGETVDPRLTRFDLEIIIGFAHEETLAIATLIFGGVLERHPTVRLCVAHAGGATPFLMGRLRKAARLRPWSPSWLSADGAFDAFVGRLWFDCLVHDSDAMRYLVETVGSERVVVGTDFAAWDQGSVPESGDLRDAMDANARRLFRL